MTRADPAAAVRAAPHDAKAWVALGESLEGAAPDRAIECYRRALALDPTLKTAQQRLAALTAPPLPTGVDPALRRARLQFWAMVALVLLGMASVPLVRWATSAPYDAASVEAAMVAAGLRVDDRWRVGSDRDAGLRGGVFAPVPDCARRDCAVLALACERGGDGCWEIYLQAMRGELAIDFPPERVRRVANVVIAVGAGASDEAARRYLGALDSTK